MQLPNLCLSLAPKLMILIIIVLGANQLVAQNVNLAPE